MKLFQKPMLALAFLAITAPAQACITCDRKIQEGIFDSAFGQNVLVMLLPFAVLAGVVLLLARLSAKRYGARAAAGTSKTPVPLLSAALVLGIGLGGFVDGIVLHQILQWHEMISARLPPTTYVAKSVNMFWDGIFHAVTLLVTLAGVVLLWKLLRRNDIDRSGKLLAGGLLGGWGLFNIVEGFFDHHLLKLHNVREVTSNKDVWNYGFLGFSVLLLVVAYALVRGRNSRA
jgi:uncharacterized membrane protein